MFPYDTELRLLLRTNGSWWESKLLVGAIDHTPNQSSTCQRIMLYLGRVVLLGVDDGYLVVPWPRLHLASSIDSLLDGGNGNNKNDSGRK